MAHKGQHSNNKTSYSTLKNITQPKVPINQNKPQKSQSSAATVHNALAPSNSQASKIAVSTLGRVLGHAQASQAQATGRAILVHNVNDEVKHVVQGFHFSYKFIFSRWMQKQVKRIINCSSDESKTALVIQQTVHDWEEVFFDSL